MRIGVATSERVDLVFVAPRGTSDV
jgi:hypothetical protein